MTAKAGRAVELSRPGWAAVVLVCRDCGKRRNGPAGMKRKAVIADVRDALRHAKPRPRVVSAGCLGPCPNGALTIAFVGGAAAGARYCAVGSLKQVATAASALLASAAPNGVGETAAAGPGPAD